MKEGKSFENDVCHLLRLQGWQVMPEPLLDYKKVDVYAEKIGDFGQRTRIAVECKDYSSQLSQQQIANIYSNYLPLIQKGLVDQIVLVTRSDLAPSAKTFALSAQGLVHLAYIDLLNSLLDFSSHIQGLISSYRSDEVSHYYVQQNYRTNSNQVRTGIEEAILHWINSHDKQPIAILAGYGMGKTTLAKHMACLLAEQYKSNPKERIPIIIQLEEIGAEQSLEGLLGKHFTLNSIVRNYNFNIFMELNHRGRFVIFLDGFDEMKHTMSWETMRFNFQQLNRLVTVKSKVALGGRPSAFLTEEEQVEALHGQRQILGQWKRIPGSPDYQELYLEPFSKDQIGQFIESYENVQNNRKEQTFEEHTEAKDMLELSSNANSRLLSLAARPVQLKMLLEILPTWDKDLDSLTVTVLYSEFIDLIIRREMKKQSRRQFSLDQRRRFVRELAWWMWGEQLIAVTAQKTPDRLLSELMKDDQDIADVKRDLLSASFIEVKHPEGYYFPHRSFQEFLVAEQLAYLIKQGKLTADENFNITSEIKEFFLGLVGGYEIARFKQLVWSHQGILPDWLINLLLDLIDDPEELLKDPSAMLSPWVYVLTTINIHRKKWDTRIPVISDFLKKSIDSPPHRSYPRAEWAKLLVLLNIILNPHLHMIERDENTRMLNLLRLAGTAKQFTGRRKLAALDLFAAHISPGSCCPISWIKQEIAFENKWYNLGKASRS
jgi:hypothetical protein